MTALTDSAPAPLGCAETYPVALRQDRPLTLLPETGSAPGTVLPGAPESAPESAAASAPRTRPARRWPLILIASPAAVAIWSGWVALGSMCGFGPVNLLPGIGSGFTVNTAITLPIGVEAYGAYALGAWLLPGTPERARRFAMRSAIGSLALGMTGQVIYHLLAAAHAAKAPWPVTVVVACMPVATLGFGAALAHLIHAGDAPATAAETAPESAPESAPEPESTSAPETAVASAPESAPARALRAAPESTPGRTRRSAPSLAPEKHYAAAIKSGNLPSLRQIRTDMKVGQERAREIRASLEAKAAETA